MDGSWQVSFTLCIHVYVTSSGGMHTEVGYLEASRSLKVERYSKERRRLLLFSMFITAVCQKCHDRANSFTVAQEPNLSSLTVDVLSIVLTN